MITAGAGDVLSGKVIVDAEGNPLTGTLALTGDAADSQVLAGKTYYNTDAKTKRTGSMPNRGAVSQALNAGGSYVIPAGYHNGAGKVTANGLAGQTSATAVAADILNGKTAWVNGSKVTGSMAVLAGGTYTPGTSPQTISCSGKKMTSNIVIGAIPAGYVNISGGAEVFLNGTLNTNLLPQGFKASNGGNWGVTSQGLKLVNGQSVITGNTMDLSHFSQITFYFNRVQSSSAGKMKIKIDIYKSSFRSANWNSPSNYYLTGYTYERRRASSGSFPVDVSGVKERAFIKIYVDSSDEDGGTFYGDTYYFYKITLS